MEAEERCGAHGERTLKEILSGEIPEAPLTVSGWVRTHRQSKSVSFIELNDGTVQRGIQLVIDPSNVSYAPVAARISTGSAVRVTGEIVLSPAKGQQFEMRVQSIALVGESDPATYPLQKKGHTLEFLREIVHLRARSNTLGAVFRVRSAVSLAIHRFFHDRGFVYMHTPIITTSDCEGAGEMFKVTTLDLAGIKTFDGRVDYQEDFFKEPAFLTVSGQLEAEGGALALRNVYTFGPTFRAENSNTTRHLAEFWMIEPEMAFYDLQDNQALAEEFIQYLVRAALEECAADLEFLHQREWSDPGMIDTLASLACTKFEVLDYSEAIAALEKSGKAFEFPVKWGIDLQTEHERYLTDEYVKGPLFVVNYPSSIKAFYMRLNHDERTVAAMDVLVPRLGEIIGGSQREERYDVLTRRMQECGLDLTRYGWYLDLRRYGTVPHAGFGLGLERLLMYVTGMQNIRDVIPFPRYPGHAK